MGRSVLRLRWRLLALVMLIGTAVAVVALTHHPTIDPRPFYQTFQPAPTPSGP